MTKKKDPRGRLRDCGGQRSLTKNRPAPSRPSEGVRRSAARTDRLTASDRPSHGIAWRSEDTDPTRPGRSWVPARPVRRFDALRALAWSNLPAGLLRQGAPLRFRFPAKAHRSTPAPSRSPEGPTRRTMLPSLGLRAPRHIPERWTRCRCGASGPARAACEVWLPPARRPPPSLRAPCGSRASSSFALPGLLLASIGLPLGRPCPHDVAHVDSPRSPGEQGGRRRLQGLDPDIELVRGAPCGTPRRSLPGLHPSRALSPPVLARAL
jgi:hypothetical protein